MLRPAVTSAIPDTQSYLDRNSSVHAFLLEMSPLHFFALAILVIGSAQAQLDNHQIYKISNKGDGGVLTMSSSDDNPKVTLKTWKDSAGQKWRAKQPVLAKSWDFKPTSNEKVALDADAGTLKVLGKESSSTGNTKYWKIRDMGEGVMQIKNYQLGTCLGSQGLDLPVNLVACDNSKPTQWTFTEL